MSKIEEYIEPAKPKREGRFEFTRDGAFYTSVIGASILAVAFAWTNVMHHPFQRVSDNGNYIQTEEVACRRDGEYMVARDFFMTAVTYQGENVFPSDEIPKQDDLITRCKDLFERYENR